MTVEHVCLQCFQKFRVHAAYAQAVKCIRKDRVFCFGNLERSSRNEPEPEIFAGFYAFAQLQKVGQIDNNIPIFPRDGKGVSRLDLVFAIGGPDILVDFLRPEYRIVAKPNGYCFRKFVVTIPTFLFRQAQENGDAQAELDAMSEMMRLRNVLKAVKVKLGREKDSN